MFVLAIPHVWTFWMGVGVFALALIGTLATLAGYLLKVVRPKYPPRSVRRS